MAKGRDHNHDHVRTLETHPKAIHGRLKLNFVWSRALKCIVKVHVTMLSTSY